ncbi:MAG: hypothetical protein KAJ66_02315 [Candidatus Omnitrophica bacterium]|nr:hypothetical protein [Candidatus Omnitrophota bacterium]
MKLILALVILGCFCGASSGRELIQAPAAIQLSSTVSDGKHTIPEIIKIAKQNGVKIVILTDCDFMRWQYGLWPLRKIIKKTVENNSVSNYGIKRYLKEIEEAQKRNPDLAIIPGVESAPFYYWSGSLFENNLKMHNWYKHMLVIGLEKAGDYRNLPSVSNNYGLLLPFAFKDVWRLWPILILIAGVLCFKRRKFNYKDLRGHTLGPCSRGWQAVGIVVIMFSLLFLFNNFPFCRYKYDQYHGERGIGPYQNFIDYVNEKEGLTFWAHPEAEYIGRRGDVDIETNEYADHLLQARDYTGFTVFYEGYEKIGCPGGIWDEVLKEYCQNKRKAPVWAIGGLCFDQIGSLDENIKNLRTIFLMPRLTKTAALKALREGRMYVVGGRRELRLDKFIIKDSFSETEGTMGNEIDLKGKAVIELSGHFLEGEAGGADRVKIKLIRNGIVIKTFETASPFDIEYEDDYFKEDEKIYYRLEINYSEGILVSNPVFLKF